MHDWDSTILRPAQQVAASSVKSRRRPQPAQGLGKTLQVLALIWTMLKQGPDVSQGPRAEAATCTACALPGRRDSHGAPWTPACLGACPPPCPLASWLLMRKPVLHPLQGRPSVRKAMVVTPSSLCQNWAGEPLCMYSLLRLPPSRLKRMSTSPADLTSLSNAPLRPADEARKWLGTERMRVMVLGPGPEGKQQVGVCDAAG